MTIENKGSAKKLWRMFYQKFSSFGELIKLPSRISKKLSEFEQLNFIDTLTKRMTPKEIELKRKKMQSFTRTKTKNKNTVVAKKLSDPIHFSRANDSLMSTKLSILLLALNEGDWYNRIFGDKSIFQLSLALYAAKKISYQQLCSVYERAEIKENKNILIYPILDQNGEFTKEAYEILLPELQKNYYLKPPTEEQVQEFKLLIATLPKSEQYFYWEASSHSSFDNHTIRLTAGVRDALGLVRFGLDEYVPETHHLNTLHVSNDIYNARSDVRRKTR